MASETLETRIGSRSSRLAAAAVAAPALAFWLVARLLPVALASSLGARLGVLVGRWHRKRRQVAANLARVYPDLERDELRLAEREMWQNAGAVLAELPHLARIVRDRVELVVAPETQSILDRGERVVYFSGHIANWEVVPRILAELSGPVLYVFSPLDNPVLTDWLKRFRGDENAVYVEKEGALAHMMRARRNGWTIGVMSDVRVDSGELLDFFGVPAPTSIAAYRVALRLGYPVIPVRAVRLPGARFRVEMEPPLEVAPTDGDGIAAAIAMTEKVNRRLERWIGERPCRWWCTKRRWPRDGAAA